MPKNDLVRYREVRVADAQDDQKSAAQIVAAPALSLTQEQLQEFVLSQIKRVIHGDNPGLWRDDFVSQGIRSLEELSQSAGDDVPIVETFVFTWATPAVSVLRVLEAGQTVVRAAVLVQTPFNGAGPTARLGTAGTPGLVLDVADVRLGTVGQYESDLMTPVVVNDNFQLTLSAPAATQGIGLLLYEIAR